MLDTKLLVSKQNIALLLLAGVIVVVIVSMLGKPKKEAAPIAPIVEESEVCRPLYGTGKQTYDVLTDEPGKLQIMQVEVDPIDVKKGETQTITVKVKDKGNNTITKESGVLAKIFLDNKNLTTALKLVKADDLKEGSTASLVTTWQGIWTKEDSTCHTYMQTITAKNNKGDESKIDLSFK